MKKFAIYLLAACCALAASTLASSGAQAAPVLDISPEGRLLGASNVAVGGALYNVTFQYGSCSAIFNGCNEISDFVIQNYNTALSAATALMTSVFVDSPLGAFDTEASLTNGCNYTSCNIVVPYGLSSDGSRVLTIEFVNFSGPLDKYDGIFPPARYGTDIETLYVLFAPAVAVPEPASLAMLGSGMIIWLLARRRRGGPASVAAA